MIDELPTQHGTLIVDDFSLDQMSSVNVVKIESLIQKFNISQCSQYLAHIHGGILDLVFDASNSNAGFSLLSSYIDHFVLFFRI